MLCLYLLGAPERDKGRGPELPSLPLALVFLRSWSLAAPGTLPTFVEESKPGRREYSYHLHLVAESRGCEPPASLAQQPTDVSRHSPFSASSIVRLLRRIALRRRYESYRNAKEVRRNAARSRELWNLSGSQRAAQLDQLWKRTRLYRESMQL